MPLNLLGRLTEVSRTYGCEGEVVRLGVDGSVAWRVVGFWMCRFEALVMIPKGFHFLVDSLLQGCPYLVQVVDEVGHGRKKTKVNKLSRRRTKTRQNTKRENRQKKRTRTQLMFS